VATFLVLGRHVKYAVGLNVTTRHDDTSEKKRRTLSVTTTRPLGYRVSGRWSQSWKSCGSCVAVLSRGGKRGGEHQLNHVTYAVTPAQSLRNTPARFPAVETKLHHYLRPATG